MMVRGMSHAQCRTVAGVLFLVVAVMLPGCSAGTDGSAPAHAGTAPAGTGGATGTGGARDDGAGGAKGGAGERGTTGTASGGDIAINSTGSSWTGAGGAGSAGRGVASESASVGGGPGQGGSQTVSKNGGAGGASSITGNGAGGATVRTGGAGGASGYVVALVQSTQAQATDITQDEIRSLVTSAVAQAGGFGFLKPGQTVVVKPNLLVSTSDGRSTLLPVTTNGITADWRVSKAVTELVRAQIGNLGKILVMEGSTESTPQAFSRLGYTAENFGSDVDEFIALEGTSCSDRSTGGLVQRTAASGKQYWMNERYANADAVISVAVMKTHFQAGITGGVKNLGIGTTPASQYATAGCTRDQRKLIPHSPVEPLSAFIADYFSLKPADFVVMDGLQGIQHGPLPAWGGGNYNNDRMNMRLILAARNAVALDTVEATIMGCNPTKVPHLTKLEVLGYGTTDLSAIKVAGAAIADVRKTFAGPSFACPGN